MPATPNLFSDSKLIEAAVAFFADAESAVARTVDEVGDAMRDGEGWTSHSGVTFIQRPAVRGSQGALVEAILRKLGPRSGHEDEIRSATWRGAAQWLTASERTPPEDAARLMLRTIGETAEVTADLVIPNYTFRRAQGVSGARIGPVEILDSEIAKARVDALDNEHVRFAIDHGRGTSIRDSAVEVSYPGTCWWVRVGAAERNIRDEGAWLIDTAISLARFLHRPWGGLAVGHKDREPHAFEPVPMDQSGMFFVGTKVSTGGRTAARYYELDATAVAALESDRAVSIATSIFEPLKNSVGLRVGLALPWLTRARRTSDRSEALLFYFTALETLLAPGKGEPISQTISRQIPVILRDRPASRKSLFQRMRQLYDMRSTLVHSGRRSALASDVRTMSVITDRVFMRIVNEVDLTTSVDDLIGSLNDATFGDAWTSPTAALPSASDED